jgi:2-keto-3-deoxy-L-rhamnonate aldolase RhmA
VTNFYYSPFGVRSWGGRNRISFDQGVDRLEYANWWNNYGFLWIQAESVNAVTSVKNLAINGVDCVSIGPNDLRFDLESVGSVAFDSVESCVKHIVDQLEGTGIAVCHRIDNIQEKQKYYDFGVNVILSGPTVTMNSKR